jgi:dTDP-4-dehydrorhamnose reductase
MNKTLVIGDNYISSYFNGKYDVLPTSIFDYQTEWRYILSDYNVIINCHEIDNNNFKEIFKNNFLFVQNLNEYCNKFSKKLIQISTCDFYNDDYEWELNTEEKVKLDLSSDYLMSKRLAERVLDNTNALILRIKNPFDSSNHPDNWLIKTSKKENFSNRLDSHTYLPDLEKVIDQLLQNNLSGIYNIVQTETASEKYYMNLIGLDKNETEFPEGSDVNSSKIKEIISLTNCEYAVISSWNKLNCS